MSIAQRRARATPPKATMNPSPWTLISRPPWRAQRLADETVFLVQELTGGVVAEPLGHAGVVDHVAKQNRDRPVGGHVGHRRRQVAGCGRGAGAGAGVDVGSAAPSCGDSVLTPGGAGGGGSPGPGGTGGTADMPATSGALRRGRRRRQARAGAAAARASVRFVRMGRLLTSIPPMTAKPRTMMSGEPGTRRHVAEFQVSSPHEREALQLDVEALGDDDVDAAHEREGRDGDLGTLDLGPAKIQVAAAHEGHGIRLLADAPPTSGAVATQDRHVPATLRRCVASKLLRWSRQAPPRTGAGRSDMTASSSPRVRASSACPIRSENSSRVSLPSTTCSRSCVTVRSRSASDDALRQPWLASSGRGLVLGNRRIRHIRGQSAPFADLVPWIPPRI